MKWFAIAAVLALALAGCGGKKDDDGQSTSTSTATGSTSGSRSTSTGTGPTLGTIEVDLNRTTPNGGAPLVVNFTLDATFTKANGTKAPAPSTATWSVSYSPLANGTGNATATNATGNATGNATQGPTGSTFPANVTFNVTAAGNYSVLVTVEAVGYEDANASFIVEVFAGEASGPILFFEGGETDTSQWTVQSRIYFNPNLQGSTGAREVAQDHPEGPWAITDAGAKSGTHSWLHPYPDNYRTRITSVPIAVPAGGATLSYALKGGAEATEVEGLFVLVGLEGETREVVATHSGVIADWTVFTAPVPEGSVVLEFRFDSDLSCSNESGPPPGFGCGEGYDAGGIFLDDITVA